MLRREEEGEIRSDGGRLEVKLEESGGEPGGGCLREGCPGRGTGVHT